MNEFNLIIQHLANRKRHRKRTDIAQFRQALIKETKIRIDFSKFINFFKQLEHEGYGTLFADKTKAKFTWSYWPFIVLNSDGTVKMIRRIPLNELQSDRNLMKVYQKARKLV